MALWNSTPTQYANTWNSEQRSIFISLSGDFFQPIRLNRTSKRISGNSLRPLEAPNKDFGEKGKLPRYCKLGGSAPQETFLNLGAQNCHILSKKRRQQFKYPVLSVRYSVTGEQGKTLTSSRRLQEKGETSSLQTGKDTNIMRQIYQSSRFNDKNAFRK